MHWYMNIPSDDMIVFFLKNTRDFSLLLEKRSISPYSSIDPVIYRAAPRLDPHLICPDCRI